MQSAARPGLRRAGFTGDGEYFQLIGEVARCLGAADFYRSLFGLFGSVVKHDFSWIVRYSRNAPPDVIATVGVGRHLVDIYLQHAYYSSDPFFCDWSSTERSGVVLLREAFSAAGESDLYRVVFQRKARYSDEMGMILPALGQSCIAFFIEKRTGRFSARDKAAARAVFPAIEGLHRAHMANLFSNLKESSSPEMRELASAPRLIVDRTGAMVYSSPSWRKLERSGGAVAAARRKLEAGGASIVSISQQTFMEVEQFASDFHLAPGGRLFSIARRPDSGQVEAARSRAREELERLSRRERQVVALLVIGCASGEVARRMGIAKGTVKNYRLSLYRKLQITSERNLISRFWPLIDEFRRGALPRAGASVQASRGD